MSRRTVARYAAPLLFLAAVTVAVLLVRAGMDEARRRRLTAALLFLAYVHMDDDYMPVVPMLGGHPNFLADVKSALAAAVCAALEDAGYSTEQASDGQQALALGEPEHLGRDHGVEGARGRLCI